MYYLYRHIRPDKNKVFYIGKGTISIEARSSESIIFRYRRAFSSKDRNKHWKNIVNLNPNYQVEILLESDNIDFIKQKEIEFIELYGRVSRKTGTLCNLALGGEGRDYKNRRIKRITNGEIIYYNCEEAAKELQVSVSTIHHWCSKYCKPMNNNSIWEYEYY